MFSSRIASTLAQNRISLEVLRLREAGTPLIDLTETNPTRVGLPYPAAIDTAFLDDANRSYAPQPFGMIGAREAVAADLRRSDRAVHADRIVLTASTSEAYAILFKLLCDAGDEVLVPQPSYPLFDLLTRLENVTPVPYALDYHGVWSIDRDSIVGRLTSRTRAVLVVSPNNPTGSMMRADDLAWLSALCADRSIAIIGDEVFADYPLTPKADACRVADQDVALTFSLGGLSKSAGLPQMKLAWIVVSGPDALVGEALTRLEVICDTYLSVSTPIQAAAARLIAEGAKVRALIQDRIGRNLIALRTHIATTTSVSLLEPEGGWSVVLQVPAVRTEEELVLQLATDAHVVVHPGYFFDFPREAFLVLSLLCEPSAFDEGVRRVLAAVRAETV